MRFSFSVVRPPHPSRRNQLAREAAGGIFVAAASLLLCVTAATSRAQQPEAAPVPMAANTSLKQLMTPEQFKSAGLKKLSPEEMQNLERFLQGYRDQAVQESVKTAEERLNPAPRRDRATRRAVIEGQIQGHFAGLTGRTRVVLADGSIWQQSNDGDKFSANLDNPDVVLVKNVFGYKMYVTGASRWYYARQVVVN